MSRKQAREQICVPFSQETMC